MRALRRLLVLLTCVVAFWAGSLSPASAAGDDYPWRLDTTQSADPWGFTKRQCVSFAAWRMAQRGRPLDNATEGWGSALTWDDTARRLGYGVGTRPVVGALAHWDPYERAAWYANGSSVANGTMTAGGYGHVGYVEAVYSDGSVKVSHYNMTGSRSYSVARLKAPRYLYVAVPTPR
jgi:surface antigen